MPMIDWDLLLKFAQRTRLDKVKKEVDNPDHYSYHGERGEQKYLPFYKTNPDPSYGNEWQEWSKRKNELEREPPRKTRPYYKPSFDFPELTPEHIRSRKLSPAEQAELLIEKSEHQQKDFEKEEHPSGWSQYGSRPYGGYSNQDYEIDQIDKHLQKGELFNPEVAKKRAFELYNKLRKTAALFYACYQEANQMAGEVAEIDYDKSYIQLVKEFPETLIKIIRQNIGEMFGLTGGGSKAWGQRRYGEGEEVAAKHIIQNLRAGFNIFNLTPDNFEGIMERMRDTVSNMEAIIKLFNRRKKVLEKLPKELEGATKEFLKSKENRDFLKFMDEHFPEEKEDFVNKGMGHLYSKKGDESLRERNRREYLSLDDLTTVRTFKEIYRRAKHSASFGFPQHMVELTKRDLNDRLEKEIQERFNKKLIFLRTLVEGLTIESLPEFVRHCYKEYRLDLGSIFKFCLMMVERTHAALKATNPERYQEEGTESFKEAFIKKFVDSLHDRLKNMDARYSYTLNEYLTNAKAALLQGKPLPAMSQLSERDLDSAINTQVSKFILNQLPNFSDSTSNNMFPDFKPVATIIKQTGKFSIEAFTNFLHSRLPAFPKEFILNLVRSVFKGVNTVSDPAAILASFSIFHQIYGAQGTSHREQNHSTPFSRTPQKVQQAQPRQLHQVFHQPIRLIQQEVCRCR